MAFWDDAKNRMKQAIRSKQQENGPVISNRADGGFSGYVPKMNRPQQEVQSTGYQQARPAGVEGMVPVGVDPSVMKGFQPVGGQTGQMPPAQAAPQPGMPQQNFGRTGYQQPVQPMGAAQPMQNQPRPQAQFQPQQPQPTRPGFGQPAFQQNAQVPPMNQPGFTNRQPQMQQMGPNQSMAQPMGAAQPMQNQQPQQEQRTFAFPGGDSFVVDGNAYKLVCRVAQITGVPSCFRVIEFMYNNEAVIVNAEQISDLVEADRCMDLIFGAACAMKQRLMRVSGKQIYLITPPQVYVAPFEPLRRKGLEDIESRWPGALQANMQPVSAPQQPYVNNVQPMAAVQPMRQTMQPQMGVNQPMQQAMGQSTPGYPPMQQYPQQGQVTSAQRMPFGQHRQDDFAGGMGRRATRSAMHTNGYTDYGGFGVKSR